MLSQEQIDTIREQLEATTPEPWEARINIDGELILATPIDSEKTAIIWCGDMETSTHRDHANHEFLAASHKIVRELLNDRAEMLNILQKFLLSFPDGRRGYIEAPESRWRQCVYCHAAWKVGEPEWHEEACPVQAAYDVVSKEAK